MKALFGIPMNTIMVGLLILFGISMLTVAYVFFQNRMMFKMGLRNLPRRGAQSSLVILGLMLATLITTAAFTTGDTIDYSIQKSGYDRLQRTDIKLNFHGNKDVLDAGDLAPIYVKDAAVPTFEKKFSGDPDIAGFLPYLFEPLPVLDQRTKLSEPSASLVGIDPQRLTASGGLQLVGGGKPDLASLKADEIYLSSDAADSLDAKTGDQLTVYSGTKTMDLRVAGIVRDELASSGSPSFDSGSKNGGGAVLMSTLQTFTGHAGEINFLGIALKGDVKSSYTRSDSAISRIDPYLATPEAHTALGITTPVVSEPVKKNTIHDAETFGNIFTTFFLILGLFSIASGVMLIFMIFVMMAAERKGEMGIARAVGAQRSNLVQSFLTEGMAYNVLAGAVGAAFGVAAALALVLVGLRLIGGFDFISAKVTPRSFVVSYCLGVVLTFLTVLVSSIKVSSVNIVQAIRGSEDEGQPDKRRRISWVWVVLGIPAMVIPPLGIWVFFRKGWGLPWAWIGGPLFFALGIAGILVAKGNGSNALASFGFSVLPIAVAMLASYYKAPGRLTWTLVGIYLAIYWLAPFNFGEKILGRPLHGDIEMFLISGIMVVLAFTLIIVYNARLLTVLFQQKEGARYQAPLIAAAIAVAFAIGGLVGGGAGNGVSDLLYLFAVVIGLWTLLSFAAVQFPRMAPALKMGVAYPLANRFRTGMTIAMFSLIVFSLTVFSAIIANFNAILGGPDGNGGWDIVATANRNNAVPDLRAALTAAKSPAAGDIAYTGRLTTYTGQQQVRKAAKGPSAAWQIYPTLAADANFIAMPDLKLSATARGYNDTSAVLSALKSKPNVGLIDAGALTGNSNYDFNAVDVKVKDKKFDPFDVEVRDPISGKSAKVTVIGVSASQLDATYVAGIYVNEATYQSVFGTPDYQRTFVRLDSGANAKDVAREIESSLTTQGVQADSIAKLLRDSQSQGLAFSRMFQGFMALGLVAGIAALGVIAFRSVVERRQQIGMLRAIGYQSSMVALTFVLESGFIAVMGILSGVVGGVIVSRNLFASGEFGDGIKFFIPWVELGIFVGLAFVVSMVMTWYPSRRAAAVPVAEALRYE